MTSPMTMAPPQREPWRGWHPKAYLAEFFGTALILFVGLSAATLDFGAASPIPRHVASAAPPSVPELQRPGKDLDIEL